MKKSKRPKSTRKPAEPPSLIALLAALLADPGAAALLREADKYALKVLVAGGALSYNEERDLAIEEMVEGSHWAGQAGLATADLRAISDHLKETKFRIYDVGATAVDLRVPYESCAYFLGLAMGIRLAKLEGGA